MRIPQKRANKAIGRRRKGGGWSGAETRSLVTGSAVRARMAALFTKWRNTESGKDPDATTTKARSIPSQAVGRNRNAVCGVR
jgi:hypothetical protein